MLSPGNTPGSGRVSKNAEEITNEKQRRTARDRDR